MGAGGIDIKVFFEHQPHGIGRDVEFSFNLRRSRCKTKMTAGHALGQSLRTQGIEGRDIQKISSHTLEIFEVLEDYRDAAHLISVYYEHNREEGLIFFCQRIGLVRH